MFFQKHGQSKKSGKEVIEEIRAHESQIEKAIGFFVHNERLKVECGEHYLTLLKIFEIFWSLLDVYLKTRSGLKALQGMLFGKKTERTKNKTIANAMEQGQSANAIEQGQAQEAGGGGVPKELKARDAQKPAKGHGRKPAEKWAEDPQICEHAHELKAGSVCPKCQKGKLYPVKASPQIQICGSKLMEVTMHMLQVLRCNLCGWRSTAKGSEELREHPLATPEATANLEILHYSAGIPLYRMCKILGEQGLYMTWSKLWEMLKVGNESLDSVAGQLRNMSAEAVLVQNDDTRANILDLKKQQKELEKQKKQAEKAAQEVFLREGKAEDESQKKMQEKIRKSVQTTVILAQLKDKHWIRLFRTGLKNAGENLEDILEKRESKDPPLQMCDASTANRPGKIKTECGFCGDHHRRLYYDLYEEFPEQCEYMLNKLKIFYIVNHEAETAGLTAEQRLALHQEKSAPVAAELHEWMKAQLEEKKVEPNSSLGKAIKYGLKHWAGLMAFTKVAGMPLTNIMAEIVIKTMVLYRKNCLFYKTLFGALVGDNAMTVIQTAVANKVNTYHYLTSVFSYPEDVKQHPELWLLWNYKIRLKAKRAEAKAA